VNSQAESSFSCRALALLYGSMCTTSIRPSYCSDIGMITDRITGLQKRVWQKDGDTNTTTTGLPLSNASETVSS